MSCDSLVIYIYSASDNSFYYEYCQWDEERFNIQQMPAISSKDKDANILCEVMRSRLPGKINEEGNTLLNKSDEMGSVFLFPLIFENIVLGVVEVFRKKKSAFEADELNILRTLVSQMAVARNNAKLYQELQLSNQKLQLAYEKTLEGWSKALQMREKETAEHTQRVTELTIKLAEKMGIPVEEQIHMRRGALLHNIRKNGHP